jgi:pimeloyl-ACP methyl ester carboxylesterase
MTKGFCQLGDGQLYFEDKGADSSRETLILNHAAFLDSRMWDAQSEAFAERYRVIRYDMRGFGKSDPVTGPRTRREDVYRLLAHLGVTRAHVLGCSMGGEIALDMALERPEMVASLIVVNSTPSGFELQGPPPRYVLEMIEAMQRGDDERASELQLRIWVDGPHRAPEQVEPSVRARAAEMNRIFVRNKTFPIADMQPHNPLNPPAAKRLDQVRCPTLVVTGALDDGEILRAGRMLVEEIANAKAVTIPNAAHVPNMEAPELFNQTVLNFLQTQKA